MSFQVSKTLCGSWRGKGVRGVEWAGPLFEKMLMRGRKWDDVLSLLCRGRRREEGTGNGLCLSN